MTIPEAKARFVRGTKRPLGLTLAAALMALVGCSAVGVTASSDPAVKLAQAQSLQEVGRFVPARQLLGEALQIYEARGNELGVAETYRQLGIFYQQPRPNVNDPIIVPDDYGGTTPDGIQKRYLVAIDWFERSLAAYTKLDQQALVSNVQFLMGRTYAVYLKNNPAACSSFEASRAAHRAAMKANPTQTYQASSGFMRFEEEIDDAERSSKCAHDA